MESTTNANTQHIQCLQKELKKTIDLKSNIQDATMTNQPNSESTNKIKTQITMGQKQKPNEHTSLCHLKQKI